MRHRIVHLMLIVALTAGCHTQQDTQDKKEGPAEARLATEGTPVTVTGVTVGAMEETVEVNAVSAFQLKTFIKANTNGYLQTVNARLGSYVEKGQELFVLKTKESQTLGNTIKILDSTLHFTGNMHIKSPGSGYITQLNYQAGDYVQDNEQLAVITDTRSFVFLLDLPYELKPYLAANKSLKLRLPDGTVLDGYVANAMPTVDAVSQTQSYVIKVNTNKSIPENLIAKVSLVKSAKGNITSLPKAAVLTDEVQSHFWIMKMTDSVTAVKVPVQKGMENADRVEIIAPRLSPADKVLLTGNYGLPDTAKVSIVK
ncbi:efflux RND transporter periplasmic adaptor subunit [Asinibacterium sp. OR53]|uniref:efflux RND transporter periplasmic adaptor subunit n=1 Tax=Asinibacterium sp. OR53 TaxID=925409 RepID=UPI00056C1E1C|nr:efflux RND transporter periplasmic adaptor subunit [Asinibacterium sp. OR53]